MKTLARQLIITAMILLSSFTLEAQKMTYTTRGGISLGFGVGGSYQFSDIANSRGVAYDFTFGSQLYKKEGAFLSADWKFRFMAGENEAFDHRINIDNTYSNIDFRFFSYDLELGLTLNSLLERTRMEITLFGGAGITHGRTFTDLYDENNQHYNFSGIDPGAGQDDIYRALLELSDGEFETSLENRAALLPTAGMYIGFRFSPSFSMGIEHKMNFSLSEQHSFTGLNMDNMVLSNSPVDISNYTSLGFKWKLGALSGGGRSDRGRLETPEILTNPVIEPVTDPVTNPVNPVVTTPPARRPAVNITRPGTSPTTTSERFLSLKAEIRDPGSSDNIYFYHNGVQKTNFTYSSYSREFSSTVNLVDGENFLEVVVRNSGGMAADSVTVFYRQETEPVPAVPYPVAEFTYPAGIRFNAETDRIEVSARIENVRSREDIELVQNGRYIDFEYYPSRRTISALVYLAEGNNTLHLGAVNKAGETTDQVSIIYYPPVGPEPPAVRILRPGTSVIVEEPVFPLLAETMNVFSPGEISMVVNGYRVNNFRLSSVGELTAGINLQEGLNTIEITVRNEGGVSSDRTTIRYEVPFIPDPPVVRILEPAGSPYRTYEEEEILFAVISNLESSADIELRLNGQIRNNFSFNTATQELEAVLPLRYGQNMVRISAVNSSGNDSRSLVMVRESRPCLLPEIDLPYNDNEEIRTESREFVYSAVLRNIENRSSLKLTMNGSDIPFSYMNNTLSASVNLRQGNNSFILVATNQCGENRATIYLNYSPVITPPPCIPPEIEFSVTPTGNNDGSHELEGRIKNVRNKEGISLIINGSSNPGFLFDPVNGRIIGRFKFKPGNTGVTLNARNKCGTASQSVTVIVEEPCSVPVVDFTVSPSKISGITHQVEGTVRNIRSKSEITMLINGSPFQGFTFDPASGRISAGLKFGTGNSGVLISARNSCGSDNKSITVVVSPPCQPPVVDFDIVKSQRPDASHELKGTVSNISRKSDITILVNSRPVTDFRFNTSTGEFSAYFNFSTGITNVVVNVRNDCGNDSQSESVSVSPPCQAPVVNFSVETAEGNGFTHRLKGTAKNLRSGNDITLIVDGRPMSTFNYFQGNGTITANLNLSPGTHNVILNVVNACGNDSQKLSVVVEKEEEPCNPPGVSFSISETGREGATHQLQGRITNVSSRSGVSINLNGRNETSFNFNPATGELIASLNLNTGTNTILVNARNECGNKSESKTVNVAPECIAPQLSFTVTPIERQGVTHLLRASVKNISNKNGITILVNGSPYQSFNFNPVSGEITAEFNFRPGNTGVTVNVRNECGSDSKRTTVVIEEEPCLPPLVEFSVNPVERDGISHVLNGHVSNVKEKKDISILINGSSGSFSFNSQTGEIKAELRLKPGNTGVTVNANNECGRDSKNTTVIIKEETENIECGTRINPGNAAWQFCLQTPRGNFNRENLKNSNFRYSGPATSLFIQPTGGGGTAIVNGKSYSLRPGQYYLFTGRLKVSISAGKGGGAGQWTVCVEADREPVSGNGGSRPKSPCE